jgi:hypothetical protein
MRPRQKRLVSSALIIGILTLILTVSAFAEKSNGDPHQPERNGRIPLAAVTIPGFAALLPGVIPVRIRSGEIKANQSKAQTMRCIHSGLRNPDDSCLPPVRLSQLRV